ncbi:MAG: HlyC/CorC family transporter [bacterium]|nr:HlyC/CorC family transporter [bacterium]
MEPLFLWFLCAWGATLLFSAVTTAFTTILRVEPQITESEQKGMLARIHEHWPRELALTLLLFPFLGMTATLVLGGMHLANLVTTANGSLHGGLTTLGWLVLMLGLVLSVNILRYVALKFPASITKILGWVLIPAFFVLYPLNSLLNPLLSRFQLARSLDLAGPIVSARDVQDFVENEGGEDLLHDTERQMISSIIDLRDTPVREVMIPRIDVVSLDVDTSFTEARQFMAEKGHSRMPVYKESIDHVVGILNSKDFLRQEGEKEEPRVMQLMRKPYFVPETKMVGDLLRRFQALRQHIAIVVDEYGGTAGIVTLEDLLEEIVGEIHDEYDKDENLFDLIDANSARVDAKIDLDELSEMLGHSFQEVEEEEFESLGGLLFYLSGRILRAGDKVHQEPFTFRVESVQRQRIAKVIISRDGLADIVRENSKDEPGEAIE